MVEGIGENILAKEFFDLLKLTGFRLVSHRCLFNAVGMTETQNWAQRGLVDRKLPTMRLAIIYKEARARSVDHKCLF